MNEPVDIATIKALALRQEPRWDSLIALIDAAEALHHLMSGIDYSGEPATPDDINRARQALARLDFNKRQTVDSQPGADARKTPGPDGGNRSLRDATNAFLRSLPNVCRCGHGCLEHHDGYHVCAWTLVGGCDCGRYEPAGAA